MGMPSTPKPSAINNGQTNGDRQRLESFFTSSSNAGSPPLEDPPKKKHAPSPKTPAPPRPSRETRRKFSTGSQSTVDVSSVPPLECLYLVLMCPAPQNTNVDAALIEWANLHLPDNLRIIDSSGSLCSGLALLRLAEDIKGKPASPPIPDNAFPSGPNDDRLDGLFRLFDFLLDNDVKMGTVSINDIRQGKREKVAQLLNALRNWEEKRKAIAMTISQESIAGTTFMAGPIPFATRA